MDTFGHIAAVYRLGIMRTGLTFTTIKLVTAILLLVSMQQILMPSEARPLIANLASVCTITGYNLQGSFIVTGLSPNP